MQSSITKDAPVTFDDQRMTKEMWYEVVKKIWLSSGHGRQDMVGYKCRKWDTFTGHPRR